MHLKVKKEEFRSGLEPHTVYTVNDVPGKDPWKDPRGGLTGSEGSFQVKDALERPLRYFF